MKNMIDPAKLVSNSYVESLWMEALKIRHKEKLHGEITHPTMPQFDGKESYVLIKAL